MSIYRHSIPKHIVFLALLTFLLAACAPATVTSVNLAAPLADPPAAGEDVLAQPVVSHVGGRLWEDLDANGVQDQGEPGLEGVPVTLFTSQGDQLATSLTDATGLYHFDQLPLGDYYLSFNPLDGDTFTLMDQGDDDALDSDVDPATGQTEVFTLGNSEGLTFDAGLVYEEQSPPDQSYVAPPVEYGPDDFPPGVNPLTGLPVSDPSLLDLPAVLISVSNFPVSARPQAGLSFAPLIYELYIGEGMTRFLTIFYGDFPQVQPPIFGQEPVREGPFVKTGLVLGNRVWVDEDEDGLQDVGELGLPGVRLNLYDASANLLDTTTTDSNGYFGFNLADSGEYTLEVVQPAGFAFSPQDVGQDDAVDSDVDPQSGLSSAITIDQGDDFSWDAGMVLLPQTDDPQTTSTTEEQDLLTLGNYVWFDSNFNGRQDQGEFGVSGVLVNLYHWEAKQVIDSTITDAFGYFSFQVAPDQHYRLDFSPPPGLIFTGRDVGDDDAIDSDVDDVGKTTTFKLTESSSDWDAGLIVRVEVGPVRSGRLPYKYVRDFFPGSCLVYAGKTDEINIPSCAQVFNNPTGSDDINNNYLDGQRLEDLAQQQGDGLGGVNYTGNLFMDVPPAEGQEAPQVTMFYNRYNQTRWLYDPLSGAYQRFNDMADDTGEFHPSYDKMTGRQLLFNNVIVMFVEHTVLNTAGTIIDLDLDFKLGKAILFRDGQAYNMHWSTIGGEYEQETGMLRPIKFVYADGTPFPLKPGNTWVHIVTTTTAVQPSAEDYYIRFYAPPIPG